MLPKNLIKGFVNIIKKNNFYITKKFQLLKKDSRFWIVMKILIDFGAIINLIFIYIVEKLNIKVFKNNNMQIKVANKNYQ